MTVPGIRISDLTSESPLARIAFPSLGYFGGSRADALSLAMPGGIAKIKIECANRELSILNLKGIQFRRNDSGVAVPPSTVEISQSSINQKRAKDPVGALILGGIQTEEELNPNWSIKFEKPPVFDQMLIFNRPGYLGIRSRQLRVLVEMNDGTHLVAFDSTSNKYVNKVLDTVADYAGRDIKMSRLTSSEDAIKWHNDTVALLVDNLKSQPRVPSREEWNHIATLIPTEDTGVPLTDDQLFLLAFGLCTQVERDPDSRGSFSPYVKVLSTARDLERLQEHFLPICELLDRRPLIFTRRGVVGIDLMHDQFNNRLPLIEQLDIDLKALNERMTLAYGTLLGAIRDRKTITHHDKVDLFCLINASSIEEFHQHRKRTMFLLAHEGWSIQQNRHHWNFKAWQTDGNEYLDVFPVWLGQTEAIAPMANMRLEAMPTEWFAEITSAHIDGSLLPVPVGSEEFLAKRYGDNWRTPDPYANWIWPLKDRGESMQGPPKPSRTSPAVRGSKWRLLASKVTRRTKK